MGGLSSYLYATGGFFKSAFFDPFKPVSYAADYWRDRRLANTAKVFRKALASMEYRDVDVKRDLNIIVDSRKLLEEMKECRFSWAKKERSILKVHCLAQHYRIGNSPTPSKDDQYYDKLCAEAVLWKETHEYYNIKSLTDEEQSKLGEVCCHPQFAKLVLEDAALRKELMNWIIPNDHKFVQYKANDPEVFIKFPAMRRELLHIISSRSMWCGGKLLRVATGETQELEVLIEGKYEKATLDGKKIDLLGPERSGKVSLTALEAIKATCAQYEVGGGDIEVVDEKGITNYNPIQGGSYHEITQKYNGPEFEKDINTWLTKIPPSRKYTDGEVKQFLGIDVKGYIESLSGHKEPWAFSPTGTPPILGVAATAKGNYEMEGTHSFYWCLIKGDSGKWEYRTIGEFVVPFPSGTIKIPFLNIEITHALIKGMRMFPFLPRFHHSNIFLFDQNQFYAWRNHVYRPIKHEYMTPQNWGKFTESIRKDICTGKSGFLGFHMANSHCTTHLFYKIIDCFGVDALPDMTIHWWDLNPTGPLGLLFNTVKKVELLRNLIMTSLFLFFGAWIQSQVANENGEVRWLAMWDNPWPWDPKSRICHPQALFNENKSQLNK